MEGEDQERKRKVEAGKAKLAQFRQRKGQSDSQNSSKKSKKKKTSPGSKYREQPDDAPDASLSQSDEAPSQSATSGAAATAEFTIMRTVPHGEIIKHDQTYTIEPESEISTTADDYSSEEEEFGVRETFSEHGTQSSQTRLEVMEDELAGKQQEIEELNRELEEMRAAYGTEGLQQLQEFEMAIKQRDGIITQLTTNLQQARREKDDIMREFLELTEQSQNLKIQFQHLQASETIRNTSRTSTAADLFQSKQQIFTYQQQLEEQGQRLKHYQKENEELQFQIVALQEEMKNMQQVHHNELEASYVKKLTEKDLTVNGLKSALIDEENKSFQLQERIAGADRSLDELREQLTLKSQEINSLTEELNHSKQKERRSSEEIKQLMGTVEDLQKKHHKGTQSEADIIHRMELETQRKLEQLQAELDEMYGQQIVHMKQELFKQHTLEIEKLLAEHKAVVDNLSNQTETNAQIHSLSTAIGELNSQLQHSNEQRTKMKEDFDQKLEAVSSEKTLLQRQIEDLLQDLSFAKEQIHRAKQSISEKDSKLNETSSLHITIENLRAELASATEFTKEMEIKHEAEVTNYKIKLEMLEREKDAVLDRMAESQEAELEKLRTHFLFSQEDDLSKLREDLTREHRTNIENLKGNLEVQYKQQIDRLQHEMGQTIHDLQSEKESLITAQNCLTMEISKLTDLLQSVNDPKSEAMMARINELQTELDFLRKEREKGSVEQDVQELQHRIKFLENELEDKNMLIDRVAALESDNTLLKDENNTLQNSLKKVNIDGHERGLVDRTDSDYHVLKKEIEILTAENKRLGNLELQLRDEIERQKNTFSFAEKNFEVNYQELKEEYACLLNIKNQLENNKIKQEEEYQVKLCVLNDELSKFKGNSLESNELSINRLPKLIKADTLEGMDIVEKDTIELMEKLELAQRDKEELSLKVYDLSEQLQFKQNEINQLKDQLKSLHQERDHVLSKGQKLDHVLSTRNVNPVQDVTEHPVETDALMSVSDTPNKDKRTLDKMEECEKNVHRNNCAPYLLPDIGELQQENKNAFEILSDSTSRVKHESVLLRNSQQEQYHLQTQIAALQQELADMALQLEAQRITLNEIHIARLKLISENLQREKEQELCNLKEEMLRIQEVKLEELQDVHQRNLQSLQLKHSEFMQPENVTGSDIGSCRVLIEMLMKRIRDEQNHINECFNRKHLENQKKANETEHEGAERLQDSLGGSVEQQHLTEVQSNLATLLDSFLEEYKRVTALYNSLEETHSRPMSADAQESNTLRHIPSPSHSSASHSTDDSKILNVASSRSEEAEKLKNAFSLQRTQLEDQHSQEIEHLRFYFQQQLKEREERYTTEIIHLQEQLHSVNQTSLDFRVLSESQLVVELGSHEAEIFKSVLAPVTEELKMAFSGPIYQQLHILRQALYGRYVDEVNALKKQHEAELDRLKADLMEKFSLENASLKKEITQLTQAKKEIFYETFGELSLYQLSNNEEQKHSNINQLLEERYRERIEEEIARVIVEMTIGFAQQTELARLATLKNGESEMSCEHAVENSDKLQVKQDNDNDDGKTENLQSVELPADAQSVESQTLAARDVKNDDTEVQSVIAEQTNEQSPIHQDATATTETLPTEKTVVLNEQDYNQMVAMGAESAKLRLLYEERVEDMRQELVRLEQERQQAIEALRLAHAAQLERQMYDQEQLLTELHTVRAQLADNVLVFSENQATERERMLLEELETLKQTCPETRGKQDFTQQDNSSQTEHEPVKEVENEEEMQEGGEENEESRDSLVSDPICDRNTLKRANKRLLKILLEIAKTTGAVEETIGQHVVGLLDKSGRRQSLSKGLVWSPDPVCAGDVPLTGSVSDFAEEKIAPIWSGEEISELSQQLTGEEFVGIDINSEDEGRMLNIVTRLQGAVEKLLEVINDTSNQLEHAKAAQTELVRESIKRKQETSELLKIQDELQERLNEEAKAREHLALELSKAEGLLDGYTDERVFLEKQMQEKNDLIRQLEQELQSTGNRLQEFEQERQQIQEERELLSRQKNALKADAAPAEQQLLEEAEKLLKEKIEVQRQAEKDSGDFYKQVKVLEIELEEQVTRFTELEQEKNADLEDLRQKNLALEKQLEKTRKFLDEQAVDREHERDVFQQEIQKLEQQLKMPQRYQAANDQQSNQVETLENNLKEKTDKCSELLLSKEQLQRDVQERNEEIEKLECRIRELEQALLISTDSIQKVEDRRASLIKVVKGEMPLEAQLQVEREAMDRKENEITNLEEQLEQFREELENKNEEVQQLHMQLEIQRKESATQIHGLEQENKTLKDECENLLLDLQGDSTLKTHLLKGEKYEEQLLLKDQEIDQLNEQIVKLQTQLEAATDNKGNVMGDLEQELQRIKAETPATKEELCHYREAAEKLQEELLVKETNVAHLEEDLHTMKKCLSEAEDKLACFMKREEKLAEEKKQSLDVLDGVGGLAQAAFDMTSSSSQTDTASSVNNSNQTPPVHLVDMGIQNELETTQLNSVSNEVREIVEQYTEKIGQMQDLHAAEILDMEARHIAEADSLRREQYVAVQTLTKECDALKSVIGALKAGRTIPDATLSDSYQFTDGASSDTGSDWSQGIYATNSFVSAPDGIRGDDDVLTDLLPNKIKNLLRAVHKEGIQVLSLTESAISEPNLLSLGASSESWIEERKSLIETIRCLKNLIGKMQNEEKSELEEGSEFPDCAPDWRGELLRAIQDVFCREQDVLMAAFHTQLDTLGSCDAATLVTQMEHRLQELGIEQINSMDCIQNADRRSLLLEIQDLRSELCSIQNNGATDQPFHLHTAGDVFTNRVQQDQPQQAQHTHSQLNSLKAKAAELQEQLNSERALVAEINNELAQTKIELESTLKQQHKHFKELESLRIELKQRTDELDGVNDALTSEQKKTRELQWVLEKEKTKVERSEEREKEELEDLKMLVEDQKLKNMELSKLIETETQAVKDLQERIASMELTHNTELSQEKNRFLELQTIFEVEKTRSSELANALQCKREMESQIQLCEQNGQNPPLNPAEDLLKELNAQLENKHKRIVELMSEMESSKLECVHLRQSMEEASKNHQREMQAEQDAARVAHEQAEELKSKVEDLQHRLKENVLEMQKLQAEKTYLKETIQELQKNGHEVIDGLVTERRELGDNTGRKALIDQCRTHSQNEKGGGDAQEAGFKSLSPVNGDQFSGGSSVSIESIQRRLQQVSSKLKQLATKASQRILFEEADNEDFVLSQNILQEVKSHLEQVAVMSLQEKNLVIPGTPSNTLTERLLTQNAELTGYVSRLTEEKNDLRNAVLRLEGEVSRHRLTRASGDHSYISSVDNAVNVDSVIASERELWNKEKVQLQKSLKHCEAELSKVKAELRSEAAHRDLGRESENSALKRIYGKYLRSESFRKALVYQKKYLLLLLGGFQECEEATLTLIARMGGRPSYTDLAVITNHTRAFTRFRSAVRVSIAISRMKFLVRRWQRATGSSINRNGFGQSSGNELRTDSPYLPSGSLEHYGDPRHSSCRSRSGFDSPQSTVNSQHRYMGGSSEISPCSHIQHYDPDRALTDYITRLEALQKRLGSVQSGSTVNNTTHYGIRR
ncbi:A-kinase anchor 9-like isoform X15 [Pelobates cultripes]|uniref:A-kinase anchor 9-like isoform X15 n=1 Tax=Pelobates cultripes TaxID=61616 RepID=A0AAD1RXR4_PELCU|nr:A-kinase anchor 9-like isoform X15 [Pelobates cultripes]